MTDNSFECVVSADLVRRALFGVSTEETRYYLDGVHVSPSPQGGAVLTATDGHLLITLHDPGGIVSGEGILSLTKQMKAALKVSGVLLEKRLLLARADRGSGRAFVVDVATNGDGDDYSPHVAARAIFDEPDKRVVCAQFGPVLIDGQFPDWRHILPAKMRPDAPVPVLDPAQLARIAKALSPSHKMRRTLVLTATGERPSIEPVVVTSSQFDAPAGVAVLMPIRDDTKAIAIPAWAQKEVALAA